MMLDPRDRRLLLESLRPPDGYHFDEAIGTSYSLDLLALLAAPLAFTFFNWEDQDGKPTADPFALLESVRRHSERFHLFCQAGEIKLPPPTQRLVAYLEKTVIPVRAPIEGGIFHPKVWIIRYLSDNEPVRYRLICLTRNLTFDRCWDTVLSLDGQLQDRKNAIRANHPIGDFVEALPGMALQPVSATLLEKMARIANEIRRVVFDLPPNVEDIKFWPLGISGYKKSPLDEVDADGPILVVAPFLSAGLIRKFTERWDTTVVSRPDQLESIPAEMLSELKEKFILSNTAEDPEDDKEDDCRTALAGLHAKVFVVDAGWNAHVFTGSANATDAAFKRNVEFVVELVGKKGKLGIGEFLGEEGKKDGMRPLLERWAATARERTQEEIVREKLEKELATARHVLASHPLILRCGNVSNQENTFMLELHASRPLSEAFRKTLLCWPSSLRPEAGVAPAAGSDVVATFGPISLEAISGFLACELSMSEKGVRCVSRFVLNLPLEGTPSDRLQRLLAAQLKDKDQLLRLLMLLLEVENSNAGLASGLSPGAMEESNASAWSDGQPLFERLVQALVASRRSVIEVGSLIEDLARTEEGRRVIPNELLQLWTELKTCIGETREPA